MQTQLSLLSLVMMLFLSTGAAFASKYEMIDEDFEYFTTFRNKKCTDPQRKLDPAQYEAVEWALKQIFLEKENDIIVRTHASILLTRKRGAKGKFNYMYLHKWEEARGLYIKKHPQAYIYFSSALFQKLGVKEIKELTPKAMKKRISQEVFSL